MELAKKSTYGSAGKKTLDLKLSTVSLFKNSLLKPKPHNNKKESSPMREFKLGRVDVAVDDKNLSSSSREKRN